MLNYSSELQLSPFTDKKMTSERLELHSICRWKEKEQKKQIHILKPVVSGRVETQL